MILTLKTIFSLVRNSRRFCNTPAAAFSLMEIMIGLLIIGLGASMVVPRLLRRSPAVEWPAIQQELNNVLYFARQEAITSQKVHRLAFAQKKRTVTVEIEDGEVKPGVAKFSPVYSTYFATEYELPEQLRFEQVKLGKKELFGENKGMAYCYVVPNGLIQEAVVGLVREDSGEISKKSFAAAPFLGTFDDTAAA